MRKSKKLIPFNRDLVGDGRRRVGPSPDLGYELHGTGKILTLGQARQIIKRFKENEYRSSHSAFGDTMWVIQGWCLLNKIHIDIIYRHVEDIFVGFKIVRISDE